eukprot:TRINITY_DN5287_c0_g2_i2.p1 TRINITY_DN5287_c0_g2~~TRINITY_DN5287_c0_g2_i2.p1  ORF type:complete len:255 (-),score=54.38 TRINITY_DN5287_c0_g2_i2:148-912(-)
MEAAFGTTKQIEYAVDLPCQLCNAFGSSNPQDRNTCPKCDGKREVDVKINVLITELKSQKTCPTCHGFGYVFTNSCLGCSGLGVTKKHKILTVKTPPGLNHGDQVRYEGKGGSGKRGGQRAGSLFIGANVKSHDYFYKNGQHFYTDVFISFTMALLGGSVKIKTLHGDVLLMIQPGTQHDQTIKITNLPDQDTSKTGMYAKMKVVLPTGNLTLEQVKILRQLSGGKDFGQALKVKSQFRASVDRVKAVWRRIWK